MSKLIDITGQQLVLEKDNDPSKKGHNTYQVCKCTNCGTKRE